MCDETTFDNFKVDCTLLSAGDAVSVRNVYKLENISVITSQITRSKLSLVSAYCRLKWYKLDYFILCRFGLIFSLQKTASDKPELKKVHCCGVKREWRSTAIVGMITENLGVHN